MTSRIALPTNPVPPVTRTIFFSPIWLVRYRLTALGNGESALARRNFSPESGLPSPAARLDRHNAPLPLECLAMADASDGAVPAQETNSKPVLSSFGFKKRAGARGNVRKRASKATSSSEEDAHDPGQRDNSEVSTTKRTKNVALGGSSRDGKATYERFAFEGDKTIQKRGDMGATAELEIETAKDRDGRALREQVLKQAVERAEGFDDDKKYRGTNAYVDYRAGFRREQTIASEKGRGAHGPVRAATNIRSTFVVDYKPDICKDYKQTGFCGWGDSCKFIHDRGDYKQGWQIDRDWEIKEKARKEQEARMEKLGEDGIANESDEELDDELPVGCGICNTPWVDAKFPVVTACKHYFCENCALKHNASSNECYLCGQATNGTFNGATAIVKRVKEVKATGRAWHLRQKKVKITDKAASGAQGWLLG